MINFIRPSIQQPWWIAKTIKSFYAPVLFVLGVQKEFWETWHKVHRDK